MYIFMYIGIPYWYSLLVFPIGIALAIDPLWGMTIHCAGR